jgi:hypothetical protein
MAGIVAPDKHPIRDPRHPQQVNGRIVNPSPVFELGKLTPGNYPKGNSMRVERPTRVKAVHSSKGSDD